MQTDNARDMKSSGIIEPKLRLTKTLYKQSNVAGVRMLSLYNTYKPNTFERRMVAAFLVNSVPKASASSGRLLEYLEIPHTLCAQTYHKAMR
jgi:hypothetical protein